MYSFFDLSGTKAARVIAATGALVITVILVAGATIPAQGEIGQETAILTIGALA